MKISLGADHRGYELKNQIRSYLEEKGHDVTDCGAHEYDAEDDFPIFGRCVGESIQNDPEKLGILICGSGIGVSIAANRFTGVRCGLIFDLEQVKHARKNDHINAIAIPSDYTSFDQAIAYIETFLQTEIDPKEKYLRRSTQLDQT